MEPGANLSDDDRLRELADALLRCADEVVAGWIAGLVRSRAAAAGSGAVGPDRVEAAAVAAGADARAELMPVLSALLHADPEDQAVNPLLLFRAVTGHATAALADLGVSPVDRDEFARDRFPDDVYDLVPATWTDIDPELHAPGLAWGAAKAFVVRARHG